MNVVPFKRAYAWPDPSSIVNFDPDVPADLSCAQVLHQAVYDANELEQLAETTFIVPCQATCELVIIY